MVEHPEIARKVQREIDDVTAGKDLVTLDDRGGMDFS